jgi:integrase
LLRAFRKESPDRNISEFPDWLDRQKKSIRRNTWYQYKQSAIQIMMDLGQTGAANQIDLMGSEGCFGGRMKVTRSLPDRTMDKLYAVATTPQRIDVWIWLQAGRIAGLRPGEWRDARLSVDEEKMTAHLVVKNEKHTNGRGNGATRTIDLSTLYMRARAEDPENMRAWEILNDHLKTVAKHRETFRKFYVNSRNVLYRMAKDAGVSVNLYSSRHQFVADLKAAGKTKPEIASLMGHSDAETATTHYGRKISGRADVPVPMASPAEIATVRVRSDPRPDVQKSS